MATLLTVLQHILGVLFAVSTRRPKVAHFVNVCTGIVAAAFIQARILVNEIDHVPFKRRLSETTNADAVDQ
jgi:hypothetical protein